ncbi:hypothetical protein LTR28_007892, partial [Elasticomyces elasticus]
ASKDSKHGKKGSKVLSLFKTGIKGTVEAALGADKLKAAVGSEHAKNRLGVIPDKEDEEQSNGPVEFGCRYHGKKGHVYLSSKATIPCMAFSLDGKIEKLGTLGREHELHPIWTVAISDIKELKKVGGLGWKAKLVVGWALDREVADGLEIVDKRGQTWPLTALLLRDELFNRLVAMDGQKTSLVALRVLVDDAPVSPSCPMSASLDHDALEVSDVQKRIVWWRGVEDGFEAAVGDAAGHWIVEKLGSGMALEAESAVGQGDGVADALRLERH